MTIDLNTDEPLMRAARCSDCAFTPGTKAYADELTRLKTNLCVGAGQLFFCHRNVEDTADIGGHEALCAGFVQAVQTSTGRPIEPEWKRSVMLACLDVINDAEQNGIDDPTRIPETIQAAIEAVLNAEMNP